MVDDVSGNRRVPLKTERTHRLHERTGKRDVPYEVIIDEHHVPHTLRANLVHHRLNRAVKVMSAHARSAVVAKVTGERTSPARGDHVSIQALRRIGVAEVRCRQRLALEVRPGHILPLECPSLHIRQQLRPVPLRRTNADCVEVRTRRVRVRSDADSTGDNRNALLAAKLRQLDCLRQDIDRHRDADKISVIWDLNGLQVSVLDRNLVSRPPDQPRNRQQSEMRRHTRLERCVHRTPLHLGLYQTDFHNLLLLGETRVHPGDLRVKVPCSPAFHDAEVPCHDYEVGTLRVKLFKLPVHVQYGKHLHGCILPNPAFTGLAHSSWRSPNWGMSRTTNLYGIASVSSRMRARFR